MLDVEGSVFERLQDVWGAPRRPPEYLRRAKKLLVKIHDSRACDKLVEALLGNYRSWPSLADLQKEISKLPKTGKWSASDQQYLSQPITEQAPWPVIKVNSEPGQAWLDYWEAKGKKTAWSRKQKHITVPSVWPGQK